MFQVDWWGAIRVVTSAAYIPAGVTAAYYGLFYLGAVTVAYGFVDVLFHECDEAGLGGTCVAGILYDYGLLSFVDLYLERLVRASGRTNSPPPAPPRGSVAEGAGMSTGHNRRWLC